jgi:hypothetical protein
MKNLIFAILMGVFFTSCGGSTTETTPTTDSSSCKVDTTGCDTTCILLVDTTKKK